MSETQKRIVIEFHGGHMDGATLASDNPDEVQAVAACCAMTHGGEVGKQFRGYSEVGLGQLFGFAFRHAMGLAQREPTTDMNHIYEVVDRSEDDTEIVIRLEYKGQG